MDQLLATLIAMTACLASLGGWGVELRQRSSLGGGWPVASDVPRSTIPWGTLAIVSACLGLFLLGPVQELVDVLLGRPAPIRSESTLQDVQLNFAFDLGLVAVLMSSLIAQGVPRSAIGIRWDGLSRHAFESLRGFLLAIGPVFLVLLISTAVDLRGEAPEHELLRMLVADGSWRNWLWIAVTAVVAAPLAEELIFRVLLQGWLEELLPAWLAIVMSSLLFCFVHRFPDSLALLPLALLLGFVQHRRRSYWTVVGIHALFNAFNLLLTGISNGRF